MYKRAIPAMRAAVGLGCAARRKFRARLLAWYDGNQRRLPWRGERDPYRIWISEIMLQQTRVNAVREYYLRFLARFPDLRSLARAQREEVLAAWSGLGYYRRARALHDAARQIRRQGAFPDSAEQLQQLPGIGRYTAAAIASIAFHQPIAAVDGNVERVLARMLGSPKIDAWTTAQELLGRTRPGDFNQAMMELGATVCLPRTPLCASCPVSGFCLTRGEIIGAPARKRSKCIVAYSLVLREQRVWLVQRPRQASLMPGMWELPECPASALQEPEFELRHSITSTDYRVLVYTACKLPKPGGAGCGQWVRVALLPALPLTGLSRKILQRVRII